MELQQEFDYYHKLLTENNRVQHIKDNYDNCTYCKQVADMHTMCARRNERGSATFFIEAMKDYLKHYLE